MQQLDVTMGPISQADHRARAVAAAPPKSRASAHRLIAGTLVALVLFVAWGLLLSGRIRAQEVRGISMAPTLTSGDRLLVRNFTAKDLKVGAIVVLESPDDWGAELVKRIIAVPGDVVQLVEGEVYVNGIRSDSTFGLGYPRRFTGFPVEIPPGYVYVLGDNRPISYDSEEFGPVPINNIHGVVLYRYFPFDRTGVIN